MYSYLNVYPDLNQWGEQKDLLTILSLVWIMPEILIHITGNIGPSQIEWGDPPVCLIHTWQVSLVIDRGGQHGCRQSHFLLYAGA